MDQTTVTGLSGSLPDKNVEFIAIIGDRMIVIIAWGAAFELGGFESGGMDWPATMLDLIHTGL